MNRFYKKLDYCPMSMGPPPEDDDIFIRESCAQENKRFQERMDSIAKKRDQLQKRLEERQLGRIRNSEFESYEPDYQGQYIVQQAMVTRQKEMIKDDNDNSLIKQMIFAFIWTMSLFIGAISLFIVFFGSVLTYLQPIKDSF